MTFGSGMHGSLGHGNNNDVGQAKIVEALIGFEVEQVSSRVGVGVGLDWRGAGLCTLLHEFRKTLILQIFQFFKKS